MFCGSEVGRNLLRNPLTHTLTHITIVYSGQGSTNGCFLVAKSKKFEKPS